MGKTLYKYLEAKHIDSVFKNGGRLKLFSLPSSDPIDCNFTVSDENLTKSFYMLAEVACLIELMKDSKYKKNQLITKAYELIKKDINNSGVYKQNFLLKTLLNATINNGTYFRQFCAKYRQEFDVTYKKIIEKLKRDTLIGSLTYTNKEYLMWDIYGDHHKGICVEYELNDDNGWLDAIYTDEYNSFDLYTILRYIIPNLYFGGKDSNSMIDECLNACYLPFLRKRTGYSFEKEVRRIFNINNLKNVIKDEDLWFYTDIKVKSIYIGSMVEWDMVKLIEKICEDAEIPCHHIILKNGANDIVIKD